MSECRCCGAPLERSFCDLGMLPVANALLDASQLGAPETRYPLAPLHCAQCSLVQLGELVSPDQLFAHEYPYFSSRSPAFVAHAAGFAAHATERFSLHSGSLVVEIASNDGYLLEQFRRRGIPCYGVEPARAQAEHAIRRGLATLIEFFSATLVCERLIQHDGGGGTITGGEADLIVANNVLAHVPDLHGFLHGCSLLLAADGVLSIEVPSLRELVDQLEVGTIYHEHYSYFTLRSLAHVLGLGAAPLRIFDVQPLPEIHGGSLRILACHPNARHRETSAVGRLLDSERAWLEGSPLERFAGRAAQLKRGVRAFLSEQHRLGVTLAGYCAAAKASTLLTWAGVSAAELPYIADTTPAKQGRYLPGARIPIVSEEQLIAERPDVIWILAPNWAPQILPRLRECCDWGPLIAWQHEDRIRFAPSAGLAKAA